MPGSPFHHVRPNNGFAAFCVPTSNISGWHIAITNWVDLKKLGITYITAHSSLDSEGRLLTPSVKDCLRTVRDPSVVLPNKAKTNHPDQRGYPKAESTSVWILCTWQSWQTRIGNHFVEKRSWQKPTRCGRSVSPLPRYSILTEPTTPVKYN